MFFLSLSLFFFKGELGRLPAPAAKNLLGFFRRRWLAPRLFSPGLSFPPLTLPGLPASSRPAVGRVRAPSQSIRRQAGRPASSGRIWLLPLKFEGGVGAPPLALNLPSRDETAPQGCLSSETLAGPSRICPGEGQGLRGESKLARPPLLLSLEWLFASFKIISCKPFRNTCETWEFNFSLFLISNSALLLLLPEAGKLP